MIYAWSLRQDHQYKSSFFPLSIQKFQCCSADNRNHSTETSIQRVDMLLYQGLRYEKQQEEICLIEGGHHRSRLHDAS